MRTRNWKYYIKTWLEGWGWVRSSGDEFDRLEDAKEVATKEYIEKGVRAQVFDRDTDEEVTE